MESFVEVAWNDWLVLRDGVRRPDEVAHDGELFYVKCKGELYAWGITEAA